MNNFPGPLLCLIQERKLIAESLHAERIVDEDTYVARTCYNFIRHRNKGLSKSTDQGSNGKASHEQDQQIAKLVARTGFFLDFPEKPDVAEEYPLVPPEIEQVDNHRDSQGQKCP
jgi:hypothetical protein